MKAKRMIKQEVESKIEALEVHLVHLAIEGDSPLLVHKFSEKSKKQMDDKVQGKAKNKKAPRDPVAEFEASLYRFSADKKKYGIPASAIKNAAVSACRYVDGIPMSRAMGAFHIVEQADGLVEVQGTPVMDERIVRIGGFGSKVAQTRYRGRFDSWRINFVVRYNARAITIDQLVNLFNNAGFSVGLCEYRPEKKGNLGMFHVVESKKD